MLVGLSPIDLERDRSLVLVDIRPLEERVSELGFIPGSISLYLGDDLRAFAGKLSLLSSEGPVVLSCVSGRRSGDAIRALEPLLGTTMHLEGGLLAWGATGFPMCYPEPHGPPVHDLAKELRSAFLAELVELALDRDDLDPMAAYERIHAATGVRPGEVTARTPLTTRRTLVDRAAATLRALGGDSERIGAFVLRLFPMR